MKYLKTYETLTKTYNYKLVLKYLKKVLDKDDFWRRDGKIMIDINNRNYKIIPDVVERIENLYNWYVSLFNAPDFDEYGDYGVKNTADIRQSLKHDLINMYDSYKDEDDEMAWFSISFEPTISKEMKAPKSIYHLTDQKNIKSILKKGLIPRSGNKLTVHPGRVYFTKTLKAIEDLQKFDDFDLRNPVILSIDTTNLDCKFEKDINLPTAIYTTDNISPKNIKIHSVDGEKFINITPIGIKLNNSEGFENEYQLSNDNIRRWNKSKKIQKFVDNGDIELTQVIDDISEFDIWIKNTNTNSQVVFDAVYDILFH